jgi:sugar phosphate isomerase/epimerase
MKSVLSAFADEASEQISEQIHVLHETSIDHVDLRLVDGINIVDLPLDKAEAVAKDLEAANIRVGMYGSPIGKIDLADDIQIDLDRLSHLGRLQNIFASNRVRIFSYFNQKAGVDESNWRSGSLERLGRLIELADKLDMVLYHENELGVYGDTVAHNLQLNEHLHQPHPDRFKLIFDFDNYLQCDEDPLAAWAALADCTHAVHFKESKRMPDGSWQHVPVGQGDGHVAQILKDLARRGFDGPFTLEPHLARSVAVLATGPHGKANQSLSDLSPPQLFTLAASAAQSLLQEAQFNS